MSAFICTETTLCQAVNALLSVPDDLEDNFPPVLTHLSRNPQDLLSALHEMNCEAVDQRYKEKNERLKLVYSPSGASPVQCLKSLRCLIYQASEGDVAASALYQVVDSLCGVIAMKIVYGLPEYDSAAWGD